MELYTYVAGIILLILTATLAQIGFPTWKKFLIGWLIIVLFEVFFSLVWPGMFFHLVRMALIWSIVGSFVYFELFSNRAEDANVGSVLRKHGKYAYETNSGRLVITDRHQD